MSKEETIKEFRKLFEKNMKDTDQNMWPYIEFLDDMWNKATSQAVKNSDEEHLVELRKIKASIDVARVKEGRTPCYHLDNCEEAVDKAINAILYNAKSLDE